MGWLAFPFGNLLADELEIIFIQLGLFLSVFVFSFSLRRGSRLGLGLIFLFIVVDEALSDLEREKFVRLATTRPGAEAAAHLSSFLLVVVVFFLLAGVLDAAIPFALARFAGLAIKRLIILVIVQLGLAVDHVT